MSALLDVYFDQFIIFVLILTRLSGVMMLAPVFGSPSVPVKIRGLLAVGLALVITPVFWNTPVESPAGVVDVLVLMSREAILGLTLGAGVMILFSGLQLTGLIIGQMAGMALATAFDPSVNSNSSIFATLLNVVTIAVFVIIGGHRVVMEALLDTFQWRPPGAAGISSGAMQAIGDVVTQSFVVGIRAAAPMIVALLMSILVMGLVSRTLPQLNILAVGFSLNAMILLATLSITLGSVAWVFQEQVEPTVQGLLDVFR